MTDAGPLLVPIRLDAAAFIRLSSAAITMRRFTMDYTQAQSLGAIEPAPDSGKFSTIDDANQGVYLMWTLPAALRHGVQTDPKSGAVTFPPAPNRWLVVRSAVPKSGATTTAAWIVESDFLGKRPDATSPYLKDKPTWIGRKLPLTGQPWAEANRAKTFLTAVAPGNPAFAAYQPDNENVFSIHDKKTDLPEAATLHYFVAGWHAHPDDDPLRANEQKKAGGYAQLLESLRWAAPDLEAKTATSAVYHGVLLGVQWDTGADPPTPTHADPQVALGATAADALTAFLKAHKVDGSSADLLEAFALDLLPVLEQPGGDVIFKRRLHDARFGSLDGGIEWQIVDPAPQPDKKQPGKEQPALTPKQLADDRALLSDLNKAQAELDAKRRRLASLQHELYELWWKQRTAEQDVLGDMPFGTTEGAFTKELDPANKAGLAGRVKTLQDELLQPSGLPAPTADVPGPTPDAYAKDHGLSKGRQLVAGLAPRFFMPQDPVVLVSGLGHGLEIDPDATLGCRYADGVLTSAGTAPKTPPIAAKGLPPLDPLLAEFVLLQGLFTPKQQAFEAAVKAKAKGTAPDLSNALWQQPWLPLYLEWAVAWHDLHYEDGNGAAQWTFKERDFFFSGTPPASGLPDRAPSGRTLLTPGLAYAIGSRLDALADATPDGDALRKLRDTVKGWDFLSQTLDGLTRRLAKRNPTASPAATGAIGQLVAGQHPQAPDPEQKDAPLRSAKPASTFEGLRAGQFALTRAAIVDRFGQVLEVSDQLLKAPPGLTPRKPTPGACAELPPRLLQGARLRFTLLDEQGGADADTGVNPICGFLVPDHIGRALAAHDAAGTRLGELRLVASANNARSVLWDSAPLGQYGTLADLARDHAQLGAVLSSVQVAGAFQNFLTAIDETLWTIDPLSGNQDDYLTALAGRPLALVRARLAFELDSEPIRDPDWPFTFAPVDPPFLHYDFPVKLGAAVDREDGLVGYFVGADGKPFHAVRVPGRKDQLADSTKFVKAAAPQDIHLRFDGKSSAQVTLLVDPRARVYARTGVLPAVPLDLPAAYLAPALAAISVAFRAGPLLGDSGVPFMPTPTASGRSWWWVEQGRDGPTPRAPFPAADDGARFSPVPATAREGFVLVDPTPQEVKP